MKQGQARREGRAEQSPIREFPQTKKKKGKRGTIDGERCRDVSVGRYQITWSQFRQEVPWWLCRFRRKRWIAPPLRGATGKKNGEKRPDFLRIPFFSPFYVSFFFLFAACLDASAFLRVPFDKWDRDKVDLSFGFEETAATIARAAQIGKVSFSLFLRFRFILLRFLSFCCIPLLLLFFFVQDARPRSRPPGILGKWGKRKRDKGLKASD